MLDQNKIEEILASRLEEGFFGLKDLPHPSALKDMDKATQRIYDAIQNKEKISVIFDYDVDGITSGTTLIQFFKDIDYPIYSVVPCRFKDGYGLSVNILPGLIEYGTQVAITVDNGISAVDAAQQCMDAGIDLIITDHHLLPPKVPLAYAIVNQKQPDCTFPFSEICGAQIAWYLVASLKNKLGIKLDMMKYMELTAIGIIADMMPLDKYINRTMVIHGLKALEKSERPAIRAFLEKNEKSSLTSEDIAFFLAPMLNSAGRLYHASHSSNFLMSDNMLDARVRLERLIEMNNERKDIEADITKKSMESVDRDSSMIVIAGKGWHEGVLGIAAARVGRELEKPCIILSESDDPDILKGSGRSFGNTDLFGVVNECRDILHKFGGHPSAIGMSIEKKHLAEFRKRTDELTKSGRFVKEEDVSDILGELHFNSVDFGLVAAIKKFEPYGQGNPSPKFFSKGITILESNKMGKEGNHLRLSLAQDGMVLGGVKFKTFEEFEPDTQADITYSISENHFRGSVTLQLMVEKITPITQ